MTNDVSRRALLRGVGAVGIGVGALALFPAVVAATSLTKVLVFSESVGSVPPGVAAVRQFGDGDDVAAGTPEDVTTTRNLAQYQALVWCGGGPVGEHADAEHDWAWYGSLVGGYFAVHPGRRQATLIVEDGVNDSSTHLPVGWNRFGTNPRGAVNVLMRLDESSYSGADRPITWWHDAGAGRAWYTGRTSGSYSDTLMTRMRLGDIRVAVRALTDVPAHTSTIAPMTDHTGPVEDRRCLT